MDIFVPSDGYDQYRKQRGRKCHVVRAFSQQGHKCNVTSRGNIPRICAPKRRQCVQPFKRSEHMSALNMQNKGNGLGFTQSPVLLKLP